MYEKIDYQLMNGSTSTAYLSWQNGSIARGENKHTEEEVGVFWTGGIWAEMCTPGEHAFTEGDGTPDSRSCEYCGLPGTFYPDSLTGSA